MLFCLSDESGNLKCVEVARGDLTKDMLKSEDVMMLDVGHAVCLWIGKVQWRAMEARFLIIACFFVSHVKGGK